MDRCRFLEVTVFVDKAKAVVAFENILVVDNVFGAKEATVFVSMSLTVAAENVFICNVVLCCVGFVATLGARPT